MSNGTLNYLYATQPISTMAFSGSVETTSAYLSGPGGQAGDGFPLPRDGILTRVYLWDGLKAYWDSDEISFQEGSKLSVYCQSMGSDFTVKVRLNGVSTTLQIPAISQNTTLYAVVEFALKRV